MLKLIPQENPSAKNKVKKIKIQTLFIPKLQEKLGQELKMDNQILKSAYGRLIHYFKKAENYTLEEMGELIHILQRSALSLEKKRVRMMRKVKSQKSKFKS